jgi:hypothetical protein
MKEKEKYHKCYINSLYSSNRFIASTSDRLVFIIINIGGSKVIDSYHAIVPNIRSYRYIEFATHKTKTNIQS